MPPEPEWRDGHWWYKNGKYYKTEAFMEYNDDRANALIARLKLAREFMQHAQSCDWHDRPVCTCGYSEFIDRIDAEGL